MSAYTWEEIVEDYRAAGGPWPFKKAEVAEWALIHGRWQASGADVRRMCADSLADAMREASFTDESGREVRRMLPARTTRGGEQGTFWDDLRTAPIAHVRIGVAQRRGSIVAECYRLKTIVGYSNDHRGPDDQIELVLDFTNDVLEMEQPTENVRRVIETSSSEPAQRPSPPPPAPPESTSRHAPSRPSYRRETPVRQLQDSSGHPQAPS